MIRMKWQLPIRSIQTNMVLASVVLIIITILVMSVASYYLSKEAVQSNAQVYTTELVKQVYNNIKSYVNGMKYMSDLVSGNQAIQEYLEQDEFENAAAEQEYRKNISIFLQSMLLSRADINSVSIFGYSGQFVSGRPDLTLNPNIDIRTFDWYRNAWESGDKYAISSSHVQPLYEGSYPWVVTLSRELVSRNGKKKLGVLLVDLNFSVMNAMFQDIKLGQRGYLFIVDSNGNIVYHPQQQLIYSNLKQEMIEEVLSTANDTFTTDEGGKQRIYTVQDSDFGWKIVGVAYVDELVGNQSKVLISLVFLGLACIIVAYTISYYFSRRISQPIKQLQAYMKEVEKGNFDIHVPVSNTIEISRLASSFNMMVGRIKNLMTQIVRNQELKRKSEMNALQAQINPHFLYNTLDSIVWMAESNKSQEVVLMTSALAKLFRTSISKGQELVTIETELEHITSYLKIQKMRYKNKLDYLINISEEIRNYLTIKVILQPIVENAIYHGIKMKRGPGLITITSQETEKDIILKVEDNGNGMSEETIHLILQLAEGGYNGRGVGVRNVNERLKLYFGDEYGLSYQSVLGEGTSVSIRFPKSLPTTGAEEEQA